jgi:isopentenyl diphosphate isomerase/L-lactate dehydrogenase-like FMN-dependent dehydrogenase
MAAEMERQVAYFDPELPETFRFLAEATKDPTGATKTVAYGGVRSAENVIRFLGRKALGIGANAVGAVGRHISKAVAATLITGLSGTALQISGALPTAWVWLRPLLDALAKGGGG